MAQYQRPNDPRKGETPPRRSRTPEAGGSQPFPWLWMFLAFLITLLSIWGAIWLVLTSIAREPLPIAAEPEDGPTIIRLTAPPTAEPSPTATNPTPTPVPTFTPVPTRDLAEAPDELTIGFFAQVVNTGGAGTNVRSGPGVSNTIESVAPEESFVRIVGGPEERDEFVWWQFELPDGSVGWGAGQFLIPAAEPADFSQPSEE